MAHDTDVRPDTLVVVDVQNDFCEGGALGVDGGIGVAERLGSRLTAEHGYRLVVATRDAHIDPGAHFSTDPDFVDSWPPHCVVGTDGVELRDELRDVAFDAVFDKGAYTAAYSGFEASADGVGLGDWLRARDVTAIDVVGIATDHCVRATVSDALDEGFGVRVLLDDTAAVTPENVGRVVDSLSARGAVFV